MPLCTGFFPVDAPKADILVCHKNSQSVIDLSKHDTEAVHLMIYYLYHDDYPKPPFAVSASSRAGKSPI